MSVDRYQTFHLGDFCRRVVVAGVKAKGISDEECKARIMLARQYGFLSDEETEEWIAIAGLAAA